MVFHLKASPFHLPRREKEFSLWGHPVHMAMVRDPRNGFSSSAVFSGKQFKDAEILQEILEKASWLQETRMFTLGGAQSLQGGFLLSESSVRETPWEPPHMGMRCFPRAPAGGWGSPR